MTFGGFEKGAEIPRPDPGPGPIVPETSNGLPDMDKLRQRLEEQFPAPPEGEVRPDLTDATSDLQRPREITLDDGTVIRLPEPVHAAKTGEASASKTDDRGEAYSANGELRPDCTYALNGNTYETDSSGRIVSVDAEPKLSPENERDNAAQREVGGKDRQEGDQGGHIVGRDLGGDPGEGNLVAMNSRINQSDYKRMENDVKRDLAEGKDVTTHTELAYSGDSRRPDTIEVTKIADGGKTVYTFDNNVDGTLRKHIREVGSETDAEAVSSVLDETGGEVSSIREVNITYTDADGSTRRRTVTIDKPREGDSNE